MFPFLKGFLKDETGQAMTEYAFVLAFVVLAVIVLITAYGKQLALKYEQIKNEIVSQLT